jgi:hydrogenase expression/formation protein HypC
MTIVDLESVGLRRGKVDFSGILKDVCLDYTPQARVGDYVMVRVGFALTVLDEQEALRVFEALRELGQLGELNESVT